ncbi:MAG: calcium-binding protein, partial [Neisseria sp.]|nr:calcium-binding protein [Neisseria sp.]
TYDNATMFDFKSGDLWGKHNMSSFYKGDKTGKLAEYFSNGARIDRHYDNPYTRDSDGDGFSDGIEQKLGSGIGDQSETPYATGASAVHQDDRPMLALIATETADGKTHTQAIEMHAQEQDGQTVYTPHGDVLDLGWTAGDWSEMQGGGGWADGLAHLHGGSGDDVLTGSGGRDYLAGGAGSDILSGGEGGDIFAFGLADLAGGASDIIKDFNPWEDKLDLGGLRPLFADHGENFAWEDVLSDSREQAAGSALFFDAAEHTLSYRTADNGNWEVLAKLEETAALGAGQIIG